MAGPGRPPGAQNKDKPYRDALRMVAAELDRGEIVKYPIGSLRAIAQVRLLRACDADGCADADKIADRLDGKVPQAVGGTNELPPIQGGFTWQPPSD
jgi:hypothetical protein